jgi:hypothetical protein
LKSFVVVYLQKKGDNLLDFPLFFASGIWQLATGFGFVSIEKL